MPPDGGGERPLPMLRRIAVVRHLDLVAMEFELVNLALAHAEDGSGLVLVPSGPGALLIASLPPQHVAERAYFQAAEGVVPPNRPDAPPDPPGELPDPPPVLARFARRTKIAFLVPLDAAPIPFTTAGLLGACRRLRMALADNAMPPGLDPRWVELRERWGWRGGEIPGLRIVERIREAVAPPEPLGRGLMDTVARVSGRRPASLTASGVIAAGRAALHQQIAGEVSPRSAAGRLNPELVQRFNDQASRYVGPLRDYVDEHLFPIPYRLERVPRPPGGQETALEAPYRLVLSPNDAAGWQHAVKAEVGEEATGGTQPVELWHTRLGVRSDDGGVSEDPDPARTVRAIWARDPDFTTDPSAYPPHSTTPFRMSLDSKDRAMLVNQTSNYELRRRGFRIRPRPAEVRRLMLSSLGAWLDLLGEWEPSDLPSGVSVISQWEHRAPMGRDAYVKVVYPGFLFPFGHRASLVKITERKLGWQGGDPIAYLFQRMFIVVRQSDRGYDGSDLLNLRRRLPFGSVRIATRSTPDLDDPTEHDLFDRGQDLFWPTVGGQPFAFRLVGTDRAGRAVEFTAPLLFIDGGNTVPIATVSAQYQASGRNVRPISGQRVAFAPPAGADDTTFPAHTLTFAGIAAVSKPDEAPFLPQMTAANVAVPVVERLTGSAGATTVGYHQRYIDNGPDGAGNPGQVFLQVSGAVPLDFGGQGDRSGGLVQPNLNVSGLSRLKGPVAGDTNVAADGTFDPHEFFGGAGAPSPLLLGVFSLADVIEKASLVTGDLAPSFVTETLNAVEAFLSDLGRLRASLVGLPATLDGVRNDVEAAVDAVLADVATLIAGNPLPDGKLVADVGAVRATAAAAEGALAAAGLSAGVADELRARLAAVQAILDHAAVGGLLATLDAVATGAQLPELFANTRLEWRPRLRSFPASPDTAIFVPNDPRGLSLAVELRGGRGPAGAGAGTPGADVTCTLERFSLRLVPPATMLVLHFDKLRFSSRAGSKPDVEVVFGGIEFVGILSFVESLKDLIPLDGFSDPPDLDVTTEGISASFSLGLPNLAVGVFSLENLSLGAGFRIPFVGDPLQANFSFCTRENPFLLTVSLFGGGGFFGITITPNGVHILEAALEFGASVSINLGVASGGVSVMAGVYFRMEADDASLTGYFRLRGEVDVLGLVSASLELYLGLSYEFSSGKLAGRAVLTIEISIAMFSKSVEISCERKFAGANGDPTFAELMDPDPDAPEPSPWQRYCRAFAEA